MFPAEPLEPRPAAPAPESRQVVAGEDVCLECEVAEAGEVVWLKGTERIQPSGHFQLLRQGQRQVLLIRGFSAEDQGEYRCAPARDSASGSAAAFQGMSPGARCAEWRKEPGVWSGPTRFLTGRLLRNCWTDIPHIKD